MHKQCPSLSWKLTSNLTSAWWHTTSFHVSSECIIYKPPHTEISSFCLKNQPLSPEQTSTPLHNSKDPAVNLWLCCCCLAQAGLELTLASTLHVLELHACALHPVHAMPKLLVKPRTLSVPNRHSTNGATSLALHNAHSGQQKWAWIPKQIQHIVYKTTCGPAYSGCGRALLGPAPLPQ